MRPTLIALALIAAAALPAQALTVFSDDFETGVKGGNVTPTPDAAVGGQPVPGGTVTDAAVTPDALAPPDAGADGRSA